MRVRLTRLGGQEESFTFRQQGDYWLGEGVVTEPHSFDVAVNLKLGGKSHQWHWKSHEGRVEIGPEMANKSGIRTAVAGPSSLERHIQAHGRLLHLLIKTPPFERASRAL